MHDASVLTPYPLPALEAEPTRRPGVLGFAREHARTAALVMAVALPVPIATFSGLAIPLPTAVERIAAALVSGNTDIVSDVDDATAAALEAAHARQQTTDADLASSLPDTEAEETDATATLFGGPGVGASRSDAAALTVILASSGPPSPIPQSPVDPAGSTPAGPTPPAGGGPAPPASDDGSGGNRSGGNGSGGNGSGGGSAGGPDAATAPSPRPPSSIDGDAGKPPVKTDVEDEPKPDDRRTTPPTTDTSSKDDPADGSGTGSGGTGSDSGSGSGSTEPPADAPAPKPPKAPKPPQAPKPPKAPKPPSAEAARGAQAGEERPAREDRRAGQP